MKAQKARRRAQAVAAVLATLAVVALGLRRLLVRPQPEPAAPRPARRREAPPARPPSASWPAAQPYAMLARVDPVLAPAVWGLFSTSTWTRRAAALELSAHFVASDTLTGLCPEAPDTLWVLSEAVRLKLATPKPLDLLYKDLHLLANLEDYEKDDFVDQVKDPMAVYVPLAVSHAPHVRESRRLFQQMKRLLAARGKTLTQWIQENDPDLRFAPSFLLRLNAYEELVPYLRDAPAEARAAARMLFPEKRADRVDLTADQIQNIFDSLASDPKGTAALVELAEGSLTQLAMAPGPVRDKITVFLHLNWSRLPAQAKDAAEFVIGPPRDEGSQAAKLHEPPPYERWPKDEWVFTQHFAEEGDLQDWERYFKAKGWKREPQDDAVVLSRRVPGGPRLVLKSYSYASLETGMLFGPALKRFQLALKSDVEDPAVQGVFVRAHAQFSRAPAFAGSKGGPKLWYDGSCRGAWDLAKLSALCRGCAMVGNVGSGRSGVNNPMIWALLEGLGREEGWDRMYARIKAAVPEYHTRLVGPWSTPFSEKLKTLRKPKPAGKPAPKVR